MHVINIIVILCSVALFTGVLMGMVSASKGFDPVDRVVRDAIQDKAFPGAVVLIGDENGVLYEKAYGHFTYTDESPKMSFDTRFDLASVTKVIATTTAVAQLYQQGHVELDMKVGSLFPDFNNHGKETITLRNLLLHNAGFKPDPVPGFHAKQFGCPESQKEHPQLSFSCISKIFDGIMQQPLENPVGQVYVYSDLSMMTAHLIVGKVAKEKKIIKESDLHSDCPSDKPGSEVCYYEAYVRKHVIGTLNLKKSGFLPKRSLWDECAPAWNESKTYRHELIQGFVSDPNSYANGGIMGHAGLFSTTRDVFQVLKAWMFHKKPDYINADTFGTFTKVANVTQSSRALGWDTNSDGYGSCGHLSPSTYLHLGYTGTQVCNDPDRKIMTLFFTNRVYPSTDNRKIAKARRDFNDAVLCSLEGRHCK